MTGKTLIAVAVLLLAVGCSGNPPPDPAEPASAAATESPSIEGLGAAKEACEGLIDPENRALSLTRDGGVLDDNNLGSWVLLLKDLGVRASESPDDYVSIRGQAIVDYLDEHGSQPTRGELYDRAYGLFEACRHGYIDRDMVAIPWPSEAAIDQFNAGLVVSALTGTIVTEEEDTPLAAGLEWCQILADEHNRVGSTPDPGFVVDTLNAVQEQQDIDMTVLTSIYTSATLYLCPDYGSIIGGGH